MHTCFLATLDISTLARYLLRVDYDVSNPLAAALVKKFSSLLPPSLHIPATFYSQDGLLTPILCTSSAASKEALSSSYPPTFQWSSCYNLVFLSHLIFTSPGRIISGTGMAAEAAAP